MPPVPTTKDVIPGASVNIVLKKDQPTGRTVAGTVATLLTRGNHPRGIKVRLTDGRVGRVQSMASTASASGQTESSPATGPVNTTFRNTGSRSRDAPEPPTQAIGLDAYITKPRRRGKGGSRENGLEGAQEEQVVETVVVVCPVCGDFEGDEAAVAHHVAGHFED
ncbi:YwbE family protein [Aspergillus mulundensis]|uniref:UBZ4-type domain-containing protein n=1 Tax=Aspergillus mulundensis TaxID=1810919 RepID=A0A3D8T550_9EURO|nr:Uncharacterized protein DSM5745_01004 [Aspergillus mulundensis]RDW93682.1 Uncharacterized protein DSM5745_01004 [Aspergillus mulundensis]